MLKALVKKQFLELRSIYFRSRKTGKNLSRLGVAAFTALYVLLFLVLCGTFSFAAVTMGRSMFPYHLDWLYFAMMSLISVLFGVLGSAFNTYAGLYLSKDNDLLLSMPIPPRHILLSRMIGVYAIGLLYESVVLLPAVVVYWIIGRPSVSGVVFSVLLIFFLALIVLALTCLLGWIIALISSKIKGKSAISVLISLVFVVAYYWFCINYYSALQGLLANMDAIGLHIRKKIYPVYLLGRAFCGRPLPMLASVLFCLMVFALTWFILSRSFTKLTSRQSAAAQPSRRAAAQSDVRMRKPEKALLHREFLHFLSSPTYMLNNSLGTVFTLFAAAAVLIYRDRLLPVVSQLPQLQGALPIAVVGAAALLAGMNVLSAPSVSLEGERLWIVRSLPVSTRQILNAKQLLHCILTVPPALIFLIVLGVVLGLSGSTLCICAAVVFVLTFLNAQFGLILNLLMPNLQWKSETVPVKQSLPVGIMLIGGWIVAAGVSILGYFALDVMQADTYLSILIVLGAVIYRLADRWLRTEGVRRFEAL